MSRDEIKKVKKKFFSVINHTWDFLGHPCMPLKIDRIFSTHQLRQNLVSAQVCLRVKLHILWPYHGRQMSNGQWRVGVSPEDIEARFYGRWLTKTKKDIHHYTNQGSLSTSCAWDSSQLLAHALPTLCFIGNGEWRNGLMEIGGSLKKVIYFVSSWKKK